MTGIGSVHRAAQRFTADGIETLDEIVAEEIAVALVYNGITVSGPRHGTWGMRTFGIEMRMAESGGPVPFVVAAVHAIFFYVSVTFLTPVVLLFGLFRSDRRLLHDLFAGTITVRRLP